MDIKEERKSRREGRKKEWCKKEEMEEAEGRMTRKLKEGRTEGRFEGEKGGS